MDSLSDSVVAKFPKRHYNSQDWTDWDVGTIVKGRNRKAQLTLIDGFDPAVFASKVWLTRDVLYLYVRVCVSPLYSLHTQINRILKTTK